jgi:hypothetical protein
MRKMKWIYLAQGNAAAPAQSTLRAAESRGLRGGGSR